MLNKPLASLPKHVIEGACELSLGHQSGRLIMRIMLPDAFGQRLPMRQAYVRKRLHRGGRSVLREGCGLKGDGWFGMAWPCSEEGAEAVLRIAAAKSLFKQLRACIFQPVSLQSALDILQISAEEAARQSHLPVLRLPCERHGKRFSIPAYKVSDFLALPAPERARLEC